MSIENMTLLAAPTIAITGGSAKTFTPDGTVVNRGISVSDTSITDIRVRPQVVCKNQSGNLQADGKWSKSRREVKIVLPGLLPDGSQDFPFGSISLVVNPLWGPSVVQSIREYLTCLLNDSDMANFWATGSLK